MTLSYLSVCSGIEAASVAWAPLGWRPALFSEIERFPVRVLEARHGAHDVRRARPASAHILLWGDFTALRPRHLRRFGIAPDILVGGTPCQAFSVAGSRRSLSDERGNLTLAFVRLAHAIRSLRWIVWENVPGVLSTDDNAFGCFLGALVGGDGPCVSPLPKGRWPRAGMVAGPWGRAAWRVLDAQHFGLAQRRKRVFVVASAGESRDPAAVLFEPLGLKRDPAAGGEARQDLAGTVTGGARSRGGFSHDDVDLIGISGTLDSAAGGSDENDAANGRLVSMLLNASHGRFDAESETFVVATLDANYGRLQGCSSQDLKHGHSHLVASTLREHVRPGSNDVGTIVTHALRGEGFDASEDGSGRGTPIVPVSPEAMGGLGIALGEQAAGVICFDPRQTDVLVHGDRSGPLDTKFPGPAICFDTTQVTSATNRSRPQAGDPCHPLTAEGHAPAIAFTAKDHGQDAGVLSPTLWSGGHGASHANAGVMPAVSTGMAVRRLTPRECERLQGFPDDYTAIDGEATPDGPRYKALGNSMAVPVMRWIGARIDAQERAMAGQAS